MNSILRVQRPCKYIFAKQRILRELSISTMSSRDVTSTSNSKFLIEVKSSQVPKFLNFKPIEKSGIWTSSSVSEAICMDMTAELIAGKQPLAEKKADPS